MAHGQTKKLEQKNILFLPKIPSTVTASHIERFFGTMVECYMKCNANGQFRECYVYFHESESALKALKNNNKMIEDHRVRVELASPSVTLRSLREKKRSTKLRLVPFSEKDSDADIQTHVRKYYDSVTKVEVHKTKFYRGGTYYKYAIIYFRNFKSAEEAMGKHEHLYKGMKTPKVSKKNYDKFFRKCRKQLLLE